MQQEIPFQDHKKPNILITGTPGTGKTTLANLLCDVTNNQFKYINVGTLVNEKKFYTEWDNEFNVPIVDEDALLDYLEEEQKYGGLILDFHSSQIFPERWIDIVILLRCQNEQLYDRLKGRGYTQKKIDENIQCELLDVVRDQVYDSYKQEIITELKSEQQEQVQENLDTIIQEIQNWKELNGK